MDEMNPLELALMSRARAALEPSGLDRNRVRAQLTTAIAATGLFEATSAPSAAQPLRYVLTHHWAAMTSVAVIAATLAFGAGYRMGQHHAKPQVIQVVQQAPAPGVAAPSAVPPEAPEATPASLPFLPSSGRGGTGAKAASSATPDTPAAASSLLEEVDLLRRAEKMIRSNNAMVAIGLLNELNSKYPKGQLLEERGAARTMANCQLVDNDSARAQGQAYLRAHPGTLYTDRVRSICHLDEPNSTKEKTSGGD
jgi:hypothetical protein